ncbi:MAG TPA: hypothetical protein VHS33_04175 [Sphingomicrobium sp.]|nr:hypothetical protein [Sphingomicrobium sp.]
MSKFALIAIALSIISAPVTAQIVFEGDLTKFTPTKEDKARSDWDKIECRAEDVLGSRLERHQVCLTKWQWYSYELEEKQRVQQWQIIGLTSH